MQNSWCKVIFAKENKFKISISEIIKKVTKNTKIVFLLIQIIQLELI